MRTKLVKRHYCDHCNKGGMVAASMLRHESTCLRNPDRSCFLCGEMREKPSPMNELIDALINGTGAELADIRAVAKGCPACILAAILQSRKDQGQWEEGDRYFPFNYKKEKEEFYAELSIDLDREH